VSSSKVGVWDGPPFGMPHDLGTTESSRRAYQAERGGFEPPRPLSESNGLANRGTIATSSNPKRDLHNQATTLAVHGQCADTDPDLALVVESWSDLPQAVRAGIVAMVKASQPSPSRTRKGIKGRDGTDHP
jgi:hypothetical protein